MGDFPRPFSMGKTKSKTSKAGANAYNKASKLMKFAAEVKLMKNAAADIARQVTRKLPSERTKEMGGPNMETPLEKALVRNKKNLPKHLRDAIEAAPESPAGSRSIRF